MSFSLRASHALLLAALLTAPFASQGLWKGQVLKQFETYSIIESLAKDPTGWFRTTVPCPPGGESQWAAELPIYQGLAAPFVSIFGTQASGAFSWICFIALVGLIASQFGPWVGIVAGLSPALLRYSIQVLPDVFATLLVVAGAVAVMRRRPAWAWGFLGFAVSVKITAVIAAGMIWAFSVFERPRVRDFELEEPRSFTHWLKSLLWLSTAVLWVIPFGLWVYELEKRGLSHIFQWGSAGENRYSGSWGLLLEPAFYARFVTWTFIKGIGLPLTLGLGVGVWAARKFAAAATRDRRDGQSEREDRLLWVWALGLPLYWVIVRQGNVVHDYYGLTFMPAYAILGARSLEHFVLPSFGRNLGVLSVVLAVWGLASLHPVGGEQGARPVFCGPELLKTRLFDPKSSP